GWQATNVRQERFTGAGWCFEPQVDPSLVSPVLALDASQNRAIAVRMSTCAPQQRAQLFYAGPDGALREQHAVSWPLTGDGRLQTYTIALTGAPAWAGTIVRLRFNPIALGAGSTTCVE